MSRPECGETLNDISLLTLIVKDKPANSVGNE